MILEWPSFWTLLSAVIIFIFVWLIIARLAKSHLSKIEQIQDKALELKLLEGITKFAATIALVISGIFAAASFTLEKKVARNTSRLAARIAESEQFSSAAKFLVEDDLASSEAGTAILQRLIVTEPESYSEGAMRLVRSKILALQNNISLNYDPNKPALSMEYFTKRAQINTLIDLYVKASLAFSKYSCSVTNKNCDSPIDLSFLRIVNLSGHQLEGLRVTFYNELSGERAYIPYANFYGVSLLEANFSHTALTEAVFVNAKLAFSRFRGSELSGARFTGADLTGAVMSGAIMHDVAMTGATLICTDLRGAELNLSPGITALNYTGLDISTLVPAIIYSETVLPKLIDRKALLDEQIKKFGEDFDSYTRCKDIKPN